MICCSVGLINICIEAVLAMKEQLLVYWLKVKMHGKWLVAIIAGLLLMILIWPVNNVTNDLGSNSFSKKGDINEKFIAVNNPPPFKLRDPFNIRGVQPVSRSEKQVSIVAGAGSKSLRDKQPISGKLLPKVTGTIFNDDKRLAIIEYEQRSIVCCEGDKVGAYTVKEIGDRVVRLTALQSSFILEVGL